MLYCAIPRLLKRQTIKIINQYHCHLLLLTMDTYVVAYIVLEQLLATSMLIVPRWAGIIQVVEAILHHLLCILYLREILLPRLDMISFEHILYIQNSHFL